ncbi:hypothetical protein [Massilia aquatica]|uniref:NERD domain-containing protein n=1 Tax=Massilia aquatica TaxID=2609000 RepID=A0ABX0MKF1_9BURK|nr:hypothetical protein [Massilia aquatica]NHZ44762.1 hypothetical protein [Massilia aquatica]
MMKIQSPGQILQGLDDTILTPDELEIQLSQLRLSLVNADQNVLRQMENHSVERVRSLGTEACFLFNVEANLLKRIHNISDNFLDRADELLHTLIALEIALRQYYRLPLMKDLPFKIEVENRDDYLHVSDFDAMAAVDYFLTYFGIVIRSLVDKNSKTNFPKNIADEKVATAGRHLLLAADWQIFHEARTIWRHGAAFVLPEQQIIDSSKSEALQAFRISMSRLRAFRTSRRTDALRNDLISEGTLVLPCAGFRSEDELISGYLTSLQFYSEHLTEPFYGATLGEWIRAYTVIKELAVEHILQNRTIPNPSELLFKADALAFESILGSRGGITDVAAKAIVKHFTFNSSSKDLLDAPLVPVGDHLFLLPAVAAQIEPAFSIESLLKSIKNETSHELATIGPGLEKIVLKDLRDAGITCSKVKYKKYDCDVAFVLDDVLFLCECKGKFLATDFHSYIALESYLTGEALTQHQRTCDYFEKHLEHMRHKLNLAPSWTPQRIERIIITSAKLGRVLNCNGYHITDENTFHAYIAQYKMILRSGAGAEIFQFHDPLLEGTRTADGFLKFIHAPPVIALHRRYLKKRDLTISAGLIELTVRDQECFGEVLALKH